MSSPPGVVAALVEASCPCGRADYETDQGSMVQCAGTCSETHGQGLWFHWECAGSPWDTDSPSTEPGKPRASRIPLAIADVGSEKWYCAACEMQQRFWYKKFNEDFGDILPRYTPQASPGPEGKDVDANGNGDEDEADDGKYDAESTDGDEEAYINDDDAEAEHENEDADGEGRDLITVEVETTAYGTARKCPRSTTGGKSYTGPGSAYAEGADVSPAATPPRPSTGGKSARKATGGKSARKATGPGPTSTEDTGGASGANSPPTTQQGQGPIVRFKDTKKKGGWTATEKALCGRYLKDAIDEGVTGETRYKRVSVRLEAHGYRREWNGVKMWWNREGRAAFGFEDRKPKKDGTLRAPQTSLRGGAVKKPRGRMERRGRETSEEGDILEQAGSRQGSPKRKRDESEGAESSSSSGSSSWHSEDGDEEMMSRAKKVK